MTKVKHFLGDTEFRNGCVAPTNEQAWWELNPQKEVQMRTDTFISAPISISAPPETDDAKTYLDQRIYGIFYDKKGALEKKFLHGEYPKTYGDARKWIKEGKFRVTVDTNFKDEAEFCKFGGGFSWGLKERDEKGYDLAMVDLKKARQDCIDIISIQTDEAIRLNALKTFEAYAQS